MMTADQHDVCALFPDHTLKAYFDNHERDQAEIKAPYFYWLLQNWNRDFPHFDIIRTRLRKAWPNERRCEMLVHQLALWQLGKEGVDREPVLSKRVTAWELDAEKLQHCLMHQWCGYPLHMYGGDFDYQLWVGKHAIVLKQFEYEMGLGVDSAISRWRFDRAQQVFRDTSWRQAGLRRLTPPRFEFCDHHSMNLQIAISIPNLVRHTPFHLKRFLEIHAIDDAVDFTKRGEKLLEDRCSALLPVQVLGLHTAASALEDLSLRAVVCNKLLRICREKFIEYDGADLLAAYRLNVSKLGPLVTLLPPAP